MPTVHNCSIFACPKLKQIFSRSAMIGEARETSSFPRDTGKSSEVPRSRSCADTFEREPVVGADGWTRLGAISWPRYGYLRTRDSCTGFRGEDARLEFFLHRFARARGASDSERQIGPARWRLGRLEKILRTAAKNRPFERAPARTAARMRALAVASLN